MEFVKVGEMWLAARGVHAVPRQHTSPCCGISEATTDGTSSLVPCSSTVRFLSIPHYK